jgi:hypothetical protein
MHGPTSVKFKNLTVIIPNLTVAVEECERILAHTHPNTTISVMLCSDDNLKYKADIAFVHKRNLTALLSLLLCYIHF